MAPPVGKYEVVPTFNEPDPPDHRAEPLLYKEKYLPGDWDGLMGLAGELYGYVRQQKSAQTIPQLVGCVKELVEHDPDPGGYDGKWVGAAAHFFTQTFTIDAALMNGLNKVICSVASILDDLGCNLANNEYYLEAALEKWGRQYDPRFSLTWLKYNQSENVQDQLTWNPPDLPNLANWDRQSLSASATQIRNQFMSKADDLRRHAGASLTAIANLLFEAASFYVNQAKFNSKSPETLLSPEQAEDLRKNFDSVKNDLKKYSDQLNANSGDASDAKQELIALGADAKQAGALVKDIEGVQKAEGFLATAGALGTLAGDALPDLAEIGLALAVF